MSSGKPPHEPFKNLPFGPPELPTNICREVPQDAGDLLRTDGPRIPLQPQKRWHGFNLPLVGLFIVVNPKTMPKGRQMAFYKHAKFTKTIETLGKKHGNLGKKRK